MQPQTHPSALAPHRGVLILVLGIVSLLTCQPLGIAPWIMGNRDLEEIRAGRMAPDGQGLTEAGKILGIIAVLLLAVPLAIFVVVGIAMLFLSLAA